MTPMLNEIRAADVKWTGRTHTGLRNGGLLDKTLADIEKLKPDELLSINRFGRGALHEVAAKIADVKLEMASDKARDREQRNMARRATANNGITISATPANTNTKAVDEIKKPEPVAETERSAPVELDPVIEFAKNHPSIITAIMNGEMDVVVKL
jgi:hypothetical protein